MKKYFLYVAAVTFLMAACTKDRSEEVPVTGVITMTTLASEVSFDILAGSSNITVNFGDGKESNTDDAFYDEVSNLLTFSHSYSSASEHRITITDHSIALSSTKVTSEYSDDAILHVDFAKNQLTALDVSSCPELRVLHCSYNHIMTLDLSHNIWLSYVFCDNNQLTASALNDLFKTLHNNSEQLLKFIKFSDNPGANDCDFSIAEEKGWKRFKESGIYP